MNFKSLIEGNITVGLHLNIISNTQLVCNYVKAIKKKNTILVEEKVNDISLNQVLEKIDKKIPLSITVDGKGIISRTVDLHENDNNDTLLNKIIPNSDISDFYFQYYNVNSGKAIVSVIRKDVIDGYLNKLIKNKNFIYSINLGFSIFIPFVDLIENSNKIVLPNWELNIDNSQIDFNKQTEIPEYSDIKVAEDVISSEYLQSYFSAISFFIKPVFNGNLILEQERYREDYLYFKYFKTVSLFAISFLFLALLVNYLIFDTYYNKNNNIEQEYFRIENKIKIVDNLKKDILNKKSVYSNIGGLGLSKYSYYADIIAMSLPASLSLNQMIMAPVSGRIKFDNAIYFSTNEILINGNTPSSSELYYWIELLKKQEWIQQIIISNYIHSSETKRGIFDLKIIIEDDISK